MTTAQDLAEAKPRTGMAMLLCFLVAALEGFDIQAIGVAAPKLGAELKLPKDILGQALAASNIGLVLGAVAGGWLADRIGRKLTLILAVLLFGGFTLLTMVANGFEPLFAARLGAGLGFGLALPNIMALAADLAAPGRRGATGTLMFCGMPLGGGTVALFSWLGGASLNWRHLFLIGGLAPVFLAALLWLLMENDARAAPWTPARPSWTWLGLIPLYAVSLVALLALGGLPALGLLSASAPWLAILPTALVAYMVMHRRVLFAEGRSRASILLWVTFFPTLLILYMVLNWLPTLIVGKGYPAAASEASVWFNYASVVGAVILGLAVDRFGLRWPLALAYLGVIASLVALARASALEPLMLLSGALGFCVLGANYALYGAASAYYPKAVRGRGSGGAVAWGRIGAVIGPLIGGFLLQAGATSGGVVMSLAPFAVLALVGVLLLSAIAQPATD